MPSGKQQRPTGSRVGVSRKIRVAALPGLLSGALFGLPHEAHALYGARSVDESAWPFVVQLDERCTGVIIHPLVVVYAGHCGTAFTEVRLSGRQVRRVPLVKCQAHRNAFAGTREDIAFCVLSLPAEVPLPRLPAGTEGHINLVGRHATVVGFGTDAVGRLGKREMTVQVLSIGRTAGMASIGAPGKGICEGDSGAPALDCAGLSDAPCTVLAIASATTSPRCEERPAQFVLLGPARAWIEENSGIRLTADSTGEKAVPKRQDWTLALAMLVGLAFAALSSALFGAVRRRG